MIVSSSWFRVGVVKLLHTVSKQNEGYPHYVLSTRYGRYGLPPEITGGGVGSRWQNIVVSRPLLEGFVVPLHRKFNVIASTSGVKVFPYFPM